MHLKDRLGDIETDCRNRLHRWLLRIMGASNGAPYPWHSRAGGGAVHSITSRPRQLFNHLIGAGKERRRHSEAKCLGRLEVDHQLVFGRALHWKVGGLFAPKDAIHVASSLSVWIERVRSVRDEATVSNEE